jgi:hypothetical protein
MHVKMVEALGIVHMPVGLKLVFDQMAVSVPEIMDGYDISLALIKEMAGLYIIPWHSENV